MIVFFRTELVKSLKHSISFSYDLGLPIYLRHLQFNLQGYRVLLTFLSGGDWWTELRGLYDGPEARKFFGYVEQGFEIADHFVNNLDGIHVSSVIYFYFFCPKVTLQNGTKLWQLSRIAYLLRCL